MAEISPWFPKKSDKIFLNLKNCCRKKEFRALESAPFSAFLGYSLKRLGQKNRRGSKYYQRPKVFLKNLQNFVILSDYKAINPISFVCLGFEKIGRYNQPPVLLFKAQPPFKYHQTIRHGMKFIAPLICIKPLAMRAQNFACPHGGTGLTLS